VARVAELGEGHNARRRQRVEDMLAESVEQSGVQVASSCELGAKVDDLEPERALPLPVGERNENALIQPVAGCTKLGRGGAAAFLEIVDLFGSDRQALCFHLAQ